MITLVRLKVLFVMMMALGVVFPLQAQHWLGQPEIVNPGAGNATISGFVFHDANQNSRFDTGEAGVPGVLVTNGFEWARTDARGFFELPVHADMNLSVVQPSGWRVPTDHRMVPQFFYIHKEGGTGYPLRFGGLADTGPAPEQVNFPLIPEGASSRDFSCAIVGDPQAYSNEQLSFLRDGVFADIIAAPFAPGDCMIQMGDVVGDDLDLLERHLELSAMTGLKQWLVLGNHDIDFDARSNNDKADSWRRIFGPNYYAFEQGEVLFVVLDNVYYPCGPDDVARGRMHCAEGQRPNYNGRLTEAQFSWLEGLLAHTPEDRLIVLNKHIPLVSFVDATSGQHQTDELVRIYALLEGRKALSLSGHTHTIENHAPGQVFEGWTESVGGGPLPFRHIVVGAASGAWFQGDFNADGIPMAFQRMGAPMGWMRLDFSGTEYTERYIGARLGEHRGQWISLNTPSFRNWYNTIMAWVAEPASERDPIPPFSVNDLPDQGIILPGEFSEEGGIWLMANVWMGSAETTVEARLSTGEVLTLARTQQGAGEAVNIGAEWSDPFAVARQLSVARFSYQSSLGEERAQGHELFRGRQLGPAPPQPQSAVANRNMHLWRVQLPELPLGLHLIEVTSTDRNGLQFTDKMTVEVREARPPRYWRGELWE